MSELNLTTVAFAATNSASAAAESPPGHSEHELEVMWRPLLVHSLLAVFLSAIIVLAVAGNVLVCVAVFTDRNLRKIGNLYIVSLSVADMTLACLVMTFALVNDLLAYWPMGRNFCDTWIAFDVMCSTASILNLCAISLDRYIHIKDPLRYGRWMSKRVVLGSIAAIWLMAALVSFLPISLGLHRPQHPADPPQGVQPGSPERPQCALNLTPLYAVVSSLISFYVPCLVMLAIYSRLYLYARKHIRIIRSLPRPHTLGHIEGEVPLNSRTGGGQATTTPVSCSSNHMVSESKAATTVGIIVGVFLVCYLPFFCVNIVQSFCSECVPQLLFQTLTWFGYSNSSFNPIIYSIFNVEFREAFSRILTRVRRVCVRSCDLRRPCYLGNFPSRRSMCCSKLSMPRSSECHLAAAAPVPVASQPSQHQLTAGPGYPGCYLSREAPRTDLPADKQRRRSSATAIVSTSNFSPFRFSSASAPDFCSLISAPLSPADTTSARTAVEGRVRQTLRYQSGSLIIPASGDGVISLQGRVTSI